MIVAIGAFLGAAGPAAADTLLASNTTEIGFELPLSNTEYAQQFTTGSNVTGYLFESISLRFETASDPNDPVYVYLQEDDGRGRPGRQVAHLTKNGLNFAAPVAGVNKYRVWKARCYPRPPHGGGCLQDASSVHVDPDTSYWVYVWAGASDNSAELNTTGFGYTGATGWVLSDDHLTKPGDGSSEGGPAFTVNVNHGLRLKIEGTTNPAILISISDATATEGTDETMDFVVSLNEATSGTVTVEYLTVDGTAESGSDFQAQNGTLTFQPGETSAAP